MEKICKNLKYRLPQTYYSYQKLIPIQHFFHEQMEENQFAKKGLCLWAGTVYKNNLIWGNLSPEARKHYEIDQIVIETLSRLMFHLRLFFRKAYQLFEY